jgi:hypothetical protein
VLDSCEVYMDESGTHDDSALVCVAGYVFSKPQAIAFGHQWQMEVKPLLPPGAEVFHANDCIGRYGKFSVLSRPQSEGIVDAMVRVVKNTMTFGAVAAFKQADYKEEIKREPKLRDFVGSAYSLCAMRCIELVNQRFEEEHCTGEAQFIFEAGNEYAGEISHFLSNAFRNPELRNRFRIGGYDFLPKKEAPPLQAADLLGWEWRKAYEIAVAKTSKSEWRLTLKSLCERPHVAAHITKESMGVAAIVNSFYGLRSNREPKW